MATLVAFSQNDSCRQRLKSLLQKLILLRHMILDKKKILRLHHVQITIPKGAEAQGREFYCGILGLQEIEKPGSLKPRGGFWLQLGKIQIHIGTEDGVDRMATKAHLAYQVSDLAVWRSKLRERGIEIKQSLPIPGYRRFEIRDPFGNRIEFIQSNCSPR